MDYVILCNPYKSYRLFFYSCSYNRVGVFLYNMIVIFTRIDCRSTICFYIILLYFTSATLSRYRVFIFLDLNSNSTSFRFTVPCEPSWKVDSPYVVITMSVSGPEPLVCYLFVHLCNILWFQSFFLRVNVNRVRYITWCIYVCVRVWHPLCFIVLLLSLMKINYTNSIMSTKN